MDSSLQANRVDSQPLDGKVRKTKSRDKHDKSAGKTKARRKSSESKPNSKHEKSKEEVTTRAVSDKDIDNERAKRKRSKTPSQTHNKSKRKKHVATNQKYVSGSSKSQSRRRRSSDETSPVRSKPLPERYRSISPDEYRHHRSPSPDYRSGRDWPRDSNSYSKDQKYSRIDDSISSPSSDGYDYPPNHHYSSGDDWRRDPRGYRGRYSRSPDYRSQRMYHHGSRRSYSRSPSPYHRMRESPGGYRSPPPRHRYRSPFSPHRRTPSPHRGLRKAHSVLRMIEEDHLHHHYPLHSFPEENVVPIVLCIV